MPRGLGVLILRDRPGRPPMLLEPVGQYRLQPEGQVPNLGGRDHDGRPHIVRGDPSLGDALRAG